MKKRIRILVALFVLIMFGVGIYLYDNKPVKVKFNSKNEMSLLLTLSERTEKLYPWYDGNEDVFYFFIPSFIKEQSLYFGTTFGKTVAIDGKKMWNTDFEWVADTVYDVEISRGLEEVESYRIKFMRSSNLPAVFISTKSGSMDYINQDKNHEEKGSMNIILSDGSIDYCGILAKVSGRGNSSWVQEKKPYAITLENAISLCGLRESKKWKLIALAREGSKMNNKLIYDMAEAMGLSHTTDAEWIDLYLNGEYNGIYLLNEAITIEEENGNDSDGYLIEMDDVYYSEESEKNIFGTRSGNYFVIHEPKAVSAKEKEYIADYIQMLESMLEEGDEDYRNYLDLASFAKRFLINEISLNVDANSTSVYFYKYNNDDLCYAGPVWDYDKSLGELNNTDIIDAVDYEATTNNYLPKGLFWNAYLYQDNEFQKEMLKAYKDLLPYMKEMLEYRIDEYAGWIEASVCMDNVRWKPVLGNYPGHYTTWEDNIRYIKYFLANRLNYLNEYWNISYEAFPVPANGSVHEVVFEKDGEIIETRQVMDGDIITDLPELEEGYVGWYYVISEEPYKEKIPVYEDTILYVVK